jgi:hypothetical protein
LSLSNIAPDYSGAANGGPYYPWSKYSDG